MSSIINFELDCDNADTAMSSLCTGFGCDSNAMADTLLSIDIEKYYEENFETVEAEDYLYDYVVNKLGAHKELSHVYWFHTTRTEEGNQFTDGIKPLGLVLPELWKMLLRHAPDESTRQLIRNKHLEDGFGDMYKLKTSDPVHWGPYGILIKDVALNASGLNHHDYLAIPEIIEDALGWKLAEHYQNILVPKIVKFREELRNSERHLVFRSLCYLYQCVRGLPPNQACVTCYDGKNKTIEHSDIIKIEIV